jgi:hypothetical protein
LAEGTSADYWRSPSGLALSRYLSSQKSQVILNDNRPAEQMKKVVDSLADTSVKFLLAATRWKLLKELLLFVFRAVFHRSPTGAGSRAPQYPGFQRRPGFHGIGAVQNNWHNRIGR